MAGQAEPSCAPDVEISAGAGSIEFRIGVRGVVLSTADAYNLSIALMLAAEQAERLRQKLHRLDPGERAL